MNRLSALRFVLALGLASSAVLTGDALAQRSKADKGPPPEYPRVEIDHFLSDPTKYHDQKMTVRGDISQAGTYYAFTNPKTSRDRRYAKLDLTREQKDWIRANCASVCVVDIEAVAKRGPPFGRFEVVTLTKVKLD